MLPQGACLEEVFQPPAQCEIRYVPVFSFNRYCKRNGCSARCNKVYLLSNLFEASCRLGYWNKGLCHVSKKHRFDAFGIGLDGIYGITPQQIDSTAPVVKID